MMSLRHLFYAFVILIFYGCSRHTKHKTSEWKKIPNKYAGLFQLYTDQEDTLLHVFGNQGDIIGAYQWGKGKQRNGFKKIHNNGKLVSLSVVFSRMLAMLDKTKEIVAVDNRNFHPKDLSLPKRAESIQIGGTLNREKLWSLNPGIVFSYSLNGTPPSDERMSKLKTLSFVWIQSHLEKHPLARAEWIKVIGWILGRPEQSDSIFTKIDTNYRRLQSKKQTEERPSVMLNIPYEGIWYIPKEQAHTTTLLKDAGFQPIWTKNNSPSGMGAFTIPLEDAIGFVHKCTFWMNLGSAKSRKDIAKMEPRLGMVAENHTRMFHFDAQLEPNGANAYWDLGACRPDLILHDLIQIRNGDLDSTLYFYRKF